MERQGNPLPGYVQKEFEDDLKCGRLEHGFLRARCDTCLVGRLWTLVANAEDSGAPHNGGFCINCGARRMVESAALVSGAVVRAFCVHPLSPPPRHAASRREGGQVARHREEKAI